MSDRIVGAVVCARMTSRRLPGKVLMDMGGESTLARIVRRLRHCRSLDAIVVATSTDPSDDLIRQECARIGVACFRGSLDDVLGRVTAAARAHGFSDVVRITADCPMVMPSVVDRVVAVHLAGYGDKTTNARVRSYPRGLDVEVFTLDVLDRADRGATTQYDREHVGTWAGYPTTDVIAPPDWRGPDLNLCVDTPEDYERMRGWCE